MLKSRKWLKSYSKTEFIYKVITLLHQCPSLKMRRCKLHLHILLLRCVYSKLSVNLRILTSVFILLKSIKPVNKCHKRQSFQWNFYKSCTGTEGLPKEPSLRLPQWTQLWLILDMSISCIDLRKGLFRYQVFLYRAFILEQSLLDKMKGI